MSKKRQKPNRQSQSDYYQVHDGEWIEPPLRGFREQCCDCGLVHRLNFRINDRGRVEFQSFRDARATNGARTYFRFTEDD